MKGIQCDLCSSLINGSKNFVNNVCLSLLTLLHYYLNVLGCSASIYLSCILLVNRLALALVVIKGVLRTSCACVLVATIMEYKNVVSVNIDFSTEIFHKTFVNDI